MKRTIRVLLVSVGVICCVSSAAYSQLVDRVVAVVNRKVITLSQLEKAEQQLYARETLHPGETQEERRKKTLEMLIENELIRQKTEEAGIFVNDEELDAAMYDIKQRNNISSDEQLKKILSQEGRTWNEFLDDIRGQIKMAKLVNREVRSQIEVSEDEVELYYQTHPEQFAQSSTTVHIRHILLSVSKAAGDADVQAIKEKAEQLVQQLRSGADFADAAKEYSAHPSSETGGELGTFNEGELAAPFDIAFTMDSGEISDPIRSDSGFHIIYVEEKTGGEKASFEKAKPTIRRTIYEQKSNKLYRKWIEELKERAYIEIK